MRLKWNAVLVASMCLLSLPSLLFAAGGTEGAAAEDEGDMELVWMMLDRPEQPVRPDSTTIDEIYRLTKVRVKMEGVPSSDWSQVARVLVATDDMADLMLTGFGLARDFYDSGVILPLSDYFDKMPQLAKLVNDEPEVKKFFLDGKLYHMPKLWRWNFRNGQLPVMRMDIVEKLGLEAPTTFEELFEVLKAMKQAYPASFPYTSRGLINLMTCSYALSVPYRLDWDADIEGGKWIYGSARDEFITTLEWLNRLYEAEILDPDYASIGGPQWQERLGSGRSFFYFDNANFSYNMNQVIERAEGVKNAFELLPTLTNYDGRRRNRMYNKHHLSNGSIVSSAVENPDRVAKFINWLYTEEGADVTNFGREGIDYYKEGGKYFVNPDLVKERMSDSDPWRSHMSYMASGLIQLGHWVDQSSIFSFIDDSVAQMYIDIENDPSLHERINAPPFTADEIAKITTLRTQIDTLNDEWVNKFILGEVPLSQFGEFQKALRDAGVPELEDIYNKAEMRVRQQ